MKNRNDKDVQPWTICKSNLSQSAYNQLPALKKSLGIGNDRCTLFSMHSSTKTRSWTICRSNLIRSAYRDSPGLRQSLGLEDDPCIKFQLSVKNGGHLEPLTICRSNLSRTIYRNYEGVRESLKMKYLVHSSFSKVSKQDRKEKFWDINKIKPNGSKSRLSSKVTTRTRRRTTTRRPRKG